MSIRVQPIHPPVVPDGLGVVSRVSVLAGGDSPEREISLASGRAVAGALGELGGWAGRIREIDPSLERVSECGWQPGEVAVLALHGPGGEDGRIQSELDRLGVVYTGCGVEASWRAFSKSRAKACFEAAGVPTPEAVVLERGYDPAAVAGLVAGWSLPLVVKPDTQGSSLGVCLVETPSEFPRALESAFSLSDSVLVERAVVGEEWTVGWLDDWPLPATLIKTPRGFFDFEAKYRDERTETSFPELVPGSTAAKVLDVSGRACRSIGTRGLVRVDVMVDAWGSPWVLEVNTIPGLTDHSLVPRAAVHIGVDLGQLARHMIVSALNAPHHSSRLSYPSGPDARVTASAGFPNGDLRSSCSVAEVN